MPLTSLQMCCDYRHDDARLLYPVDDVCTCTTLQELTLNSQQITDSGGLVRLPQMVYDGLPAPYGFEAFISNLCSLLGLALHRRWAQPCIVAEQILQVTQITRLELQNPFEGRGAPEDAEAAVAAEERICKSIGSLPQLQLLLLHGTFLDTNAMNILLQNLPASVIGLSSTINAWGDDAGPYLGALTSIQALTSHVDIFPEELIVHLSTLTCLKSMHLCGGDYTSLEPLQAEGTVELLRSLSEGAHGGLTRLVLWGNHLSVSAAPILATLTGIRRLVCFFVSAAPLTDELATALATAFACMQSLEALLLHFCPNINSLGLAAKVELLRSTMHVSAVTVIEKEGYDRVTSNKCGWSFSRDLPEQAACQALFEFFGIRLDSV